MATQLRLEIGSIEDLMHLYKTHKYVRFLRRAAGVPLHSLPENIYQLTAGLTNHPDIRIREEARFTLSAIGYY